AKKTRILRIVVDDVNALHQHSHHLSAGQESSGPADERDLPSFRAALDEELADDLLASWGKKLGEVGDQIEKAGLATDATGGQCHGDQQRWEKGEKQVEGSGLREHGAARKNPSKGAPDSPCEGCGRRHRSALYGSCLAGVIRTVVRA